MLNLPNRLTILRILMAPVITILLLYNFRGVALGMFVLAGLTDALDGFLARTRGEKTPLGRVLDPLADKLLLTSCFVTLTFVTRTLPRWLTVIVVSRDLILVGGALLLYIFTGKLGLSPSSVGKLTTGLQLATVLYTLVTLGDAGWPLLSLTLVTATAASTVASGLDYIFRGARLFSDH